MRVHESAVMHMSGMRVGGDARTVSPRMWAAASDTMWSSHRDSCTMSVDNNNGFSGNNPFLDRLPEN